ncbi:MAG: hypothetical protein ACK4S0_13810, partial [Sediminibacterium sp.]
FVSKGIPARLTDTIQLKGAKERTKLDKNANFVVITLNSLIKSLKDFKVEQIELWVNAGAETGGATRLLISAKGEGGIKILLKPK